MSWSFALEPTKCDNNKNTLKNNKKINSTTTKMNTRNRDNEGEERGGKAMKKEKREKGRNKNREEKTRKNLIYFIHLKLQVVFSYFVPQVSMRLMCMFFLLKPEAPQQW